MPEFRLTYEHEAWSSRVIPLLFEGMSEVWQEAVSPSLYFDVPVSKADRVVYAHSTDGDTVGVICFRVVGPEARVTLLFVEPSSRRLGLGTLLWNRMLEAAGQEGALTVRMEMDSSNEAGRGLAGHVGAEDVVTVFEQDVPTPPK